MVEYSEIDPFEDLQPGDQIAIQGLFKDMHKSLHALYPIFSSKDYYYHHGIFIGDNTVVHFHGETAKEARVCKVKLWEFVQRAADKRVYRVDHDKDKILPVAESLRRAEEVLANDETNGEDKWPGYNILWNNCETLATWIKTGEKLSDQASKAMLRGSSSVAVVGSLASVGSFAIGMSGTIPN